MVWLEPDPSNVRKNRIAMRVAAFLLVVLAVLLAGILIYFGNSRIGTQLVLPVGGLAAIATQDMAVFLGQPQMAIYNRQILTEELFPRLADAQRVSVLQMQRTLIRLRHPQGLLTLLAIFCIGVGAVWMLAQQAV